MAIAKEQLRQIIKDNDLKSVKDFSTLLKIRYRTKNRHSLVLNKKYLNFKSQKNSSALKKVYLVYLFSKDEKNLLKNHVRNVLLRQKGSAV